MPKFPITAPLHWCPECNVPIMDAGICTVCDKRGIEVRIYPPADVRPAFENDIRLIRGVVEAQFGKGTGEVVPFNRVVLLNKAPAIDHLDDIIVNGRSVGSIGFDLFAMKWVFRPRAQGARVMASAIGKRYVRIKNSARRYVLRGRDVYSSNIAEVGPDVSKGEYVLILPDKDDEALGVGKVMNEIGVGSKAVAVRVTSYIGGSSSSSSGGQAVSSPKKGGQNWQDVISSNEATLIRREQKAKRFMERLASKKSDLPSAISFSGGKDSLAMLLLSSDVIKGPAVFINTGLEMPETVEHTHQVVPKLGFDLVEENAGDIFWNSLGVFGPPSKDYRWCCKTSKLSPVVKLTRNKFPGGCLMFVGQRRYESLTRARRSDIWVNPWIPLNIEASPINDWTSLHVWLYLMKKKVDPNPLYFEGMDRIGCWLCPACEMAEFKIVEKKHPDLWNRWESFLKQWAKKVGYDERWVTYGLWRWRRYPGDIRTFIAAQGISVTPKQIDHQQETLTLSLVGGVRPCGRGGVSVEGAFNRALPLEKAANILNSVGIIKKTKGAVRIWSKETNIYLFSDGRIVVNSPDERNAYQNALKLGMAVIRTERCIQCGSCISICPTGAVTLNSGPVINEAKCSHCGLCTKVCPVSHFGAGSDSRHTMLRTEQSPVTD
ncbi:MAG: phosphoadenosine phosphosulfate reductase family protein [Candidatus Atabeyarchaeum deiterrae]